MDSSLKTVETAHARLGLAFNNSRIAQTELTAAFTRSIDAFGAGASPIRILSTEMGRLTEAASFLGGGAGNGVLGTLIRFIGGPWGIAMLFAGSIVAKLATAHKDASGSVDELVEKMRKQAQEAQNQKAADDIWGKSIDGIIDRNEKLIDTLQKRLKAEEDLDQQELRKALQQNATARADLPLQQTAKSNLERQIAVTVQQGAGQGLGSNVGGVVEARLKTLQSQLDAVNAAIDRDQKAILATQGAVAQSTVAIGESMGKALADSTAQIDLWSKSYIEALHAIEIRTPDATATISEAFYRLQKAMQDAASAKVPFLPAQSQANALGKELNAGQITVQKYHDKVVALAAALEAAAEAAKNAKKGAGEFGKQIGFSDAEAIARSAGLTVTSGYRSVADQARLFNDPRYNHPGNPVARPGMSAHNGINGRWALDIAFAPGLTAEKLKKVYGDQGVTLSAIYKESGHFHIEGSRSQAAAQENAAARAAQKQQVGDDTFARESAQLDAELLQVKKESVTDFNQQANIAERELESQRTAQVEAVKRQVDAKQITDAQGKILTAKIDELTTARKAVVEQQRVVQALDQQAAALDQAYGFQIDDLKFADDMATTQAQHRKLQLEILDIQYKQKEADLALLLKKQNELGDLEGAARTQAQIGRLPTDKAQDQARVERGTMDPLQAWAQQIPHDAAMVKEALQSIEAHGLNDLADAITSVVTGTESMGKAFKDVARSIIGDLVQMTVKMLIFRALSSVLGGAFGGSGGGSINVSGATSSLVGAGLPHLAGGGIFDVGGFGSADNKVLSIDGVRRAMVNGSEQIAVIPKTPRISIPANNNTPQQVELKIGFGAAPEFAPYVQEVAGQAAVGAIHVSTDHTNRTIKALRRPSISGGSR